jgi:amino acid transporter
MSKRGPERSGSRVAAALAQGRLGVAAVAFVAMAAIAPLTVVAGGATTGWAVTGITGIPVAYLATGVILVVFSAGYVAMSAKIVNSGALYTYIARGLGKTAGVCASFVAVLAYNAMPIGLYGGFGKVLADVLHDRAGITTPWYVWAFAGCAVAGVLGLLRIDLNGWVLAVLLVAEVSLTVVFAVVNVRHPAGGHVSYDTLAPHHLLGGGIGAALAIAVTGFVGFEGTAVYGEESRNPRSTVRRATYLTVVVAVLLYGFASWSMTVRTGPEQIVARAQAESTELMFNLAAPYVAQPLIDLGHLLFITSLFAAALSFHHTSARYFFALGREGVLPAWLGRTSVRMGAPKYGSLLQTALAAGVIALYSAKGWDPMTRLFFWITVLSGLGVLILLVATSTAVLGFFRHSTNRGTDVSVWSARIAPGLSAVALAWVLVVTVKQFGTLLGVGPADPVRWQLPALYLLVAVAGLIWAVVLKRTRPQVWAGIGRGANSVVPVEPVPSTAGAGR